MILTSEAHVSRRSAEDVLARVLAHTPVPARADAPAPARRLR
jgi:hypothetical protein